MRTALGFMVLLGTLYIRLALLLGSVATVLVISLLLFQPLASAALPTQASVFASSGFEHLRIVSPGLLMLAAGIVFGLSLRDMLGSQKKEVTELRERIGELEDLVTNAMRHDSAHSFRN